jgi:HEXXH motif-containing protein
MFSFMSRQAVEHMMRRVTTSSAGPPGAGDGWLVLRRTYMSHMQAKHGYPFPIDRRRARPFVEWKYAEPSWRRTVTYLTMVDDFSKLGGVSADEGKRVASNIRDGLDLLRSYDSDQTESVTRLVGCVFVAPVKALHSVSSGRCLGAIALNPKSSWSTLDYASTLLHEAVHQALYLSNIADRLYSRAISELAKGDAPVTSPIRRVRRPYNLALHAACVLVELLYLYQWADRPIPPDEGSLELLGVCVEELQARRNNLTEQGYTVLCELRELSNALLVAAT